MFVLPILLRTDQAVTFSLWPVVFNYISISGNVHFVLMKEFFICTFQTSQLYIQSFYESLFNTTKYSAVHFSHHQRRF